MRKDTIFSHFSEKVSISISRIFAKKFKNHWKRKLQNNKWWRAQHILILVRIKFFFTKISQKLDRHLRKRNFANFPLSGQIPCGYGKGHSCSTIFKTDACITGCRCIFLLIKYIM
jgi:hypothetical protein